MIDEERLAVQKTMKETEKKYQEVKTTLLKLDRSVRTLQDITVHQLYDALCYPKVRNMSKLMKTIPRSFTNKKSVLQQMWSCFTLYERERVRQKKALCDQVSATTFSK